MIEKNIPELIKGETFVYKTVGINHQFRCTFDRIEYISGYPVLYGVLSTGIQYEHPLSVQELKNEKVIIV